MSILNNSKFLNSVATFVKLASSKLEKDAHKIDLLRDDNLQLRKKEAADAIYQERYEIALRKVAEKLYNTDFLTDEYEKRNFLKKAAEDPIYVANFLEKVCEAADVAPIGKPARVAAKPKEAQDDPVMKRAFGLNTETIFDE